MTPESLVAHLRSDAGRIAELTRRGPLDAVVPPCPGWDVRHLVVHVGVIHRWALAALRTGEPPRGIGEMAPSDDIGADDLATWYAAAATDLADELATVDPGAPTWHPFPCDQVAGFWVRRQAHEAAMHRRDLEVALGDVTPIDAALASDGIDEYFVATVPRLVDRDGLEPPTGSVHVHCTDVDGEWLVWFDGDELRLRREHAKGDAALRGPAEALLLHLWSRRDADVGEIEVIGDEDVAAAWLAVPGG